MYLCDNCKGTIRSSLTITIYHSHVTRILSFFIFSSKTLVMLRPHCLDDDHENDNDGGSLCRLLQDENSNSDGTAAAVEIQMTVRNGEGTKLNPVPIVLAEPHEIPKQTGWMEVGNDDVVSVDEFELLGDRYILKGQSNLNTIGDDESASGMLKLLNSPDVTSVTNQHQLEIQTSDGSWVRNIYLPVTVMGFASSSTLIPSTTKVQVTCNSGYPVTLWYPNMETGGFRKQHLSRGETVVALLVNQGTTWITQNDVIHNDYVFGHHFYTTTLEAHWVVPGMTLEFSMVEVLVAAAAANADAEADAEADAIMTMGVLEEIEVGGVTELMITTLDAGFLTAPRNEFTFAKEAALVRVCVVLLYYVVLCCIMLCSFIL